MKYEEIYKDWNYLFRRVGFAADMTGGYVDSEDLDELLKSPSKSTACKCLRRQITYWFQVGLEQDCEHLGKTIYELCDEFPEIREIAERNHEELSDCPPNFCQRG